MANVLDITVDNPDELLNAGAYGASARVRLQTAAAAAGPFTDVAGTGSTPVITIVAATFSYTGYDPAGAEASWYRTRYESLDGTRLSSWTDPFQVGAVTYADLDDLKEEVKPPTSQSDNHLLDLLVQATGSINELCERDFFRHPFAGTETRLFSGSGTRRLRVKAGIISLSTVELATATGQAYATLAGTDWYLEPFEQGPGWPSESVVLSDVSEFSSWYTGHQTVRLTGQFGFPEVPELVRKATIDLAREWYRAGPGGGGPVGVNRYGTPVFGGELPYSVQKAMKIYSAKSAIH